MIFKILNTMLRNFVSGLLVLVACCCMTVCKMFCSAAQWLAKLACKVSGVEM